MKYIFYRIECKDPNVKDCYVSATTDINKTIRKHTKRVYKNHPSKLYQCIRSNGYVSNWNIRLITEYETHTDEDITHILKHYILCYNANLNYEEEQL